MDMTLLWDGVLTLLVGLIMWNVKQASSELHRIQVLLNRTREEVAKDYVTKAEVHADINRVLDRLERLDEKLDRIIEKR